MYINEKMLLQKDITMKIKEDFKLRILKTKKIKIFKRPYSDLIKKIHDYVDFHINIDALFGWTVCN